MASLFCGQTARANKKKNKEHQQLLLLRLLSRRGWVGNTSESGRGKEPRRLEMCHDLREEQATDTNCEFIETKASQSGLGSFVIWRHLRLAVVRLLWWPCVVARRGASCEGLGRLIEMILYVVRATALARD